MHPLLTLTHLYISLAIFTNPGAKIIFPLADDNNSTIIDHPAPGFELSDLNGEQVILSSYKGQFVVIHIATPWCPFCNAEAPYLEKLS